MTDSPDFLVCILAYLLGSIPFGLLLTRLAGLGDIRDIGSGNIGATNVLRTGKRALALTTLLLDGLKGTVAVLIAAVFAKEMILTAALLVLLGHMFPVWLKFKGGKGVATALGIWLALSPAVFVGIVFAWGVTAYFTRMSSAGALAAMLSLPGFCMLFEPEYILLALLMTLLVAVKHRANIQRIFAGTEPKIGKSNNNE